MTNIVLIHHSNSRKFGLDLVRTIAISLVIISHFVKALEYIGFWGVELFFGLSGFLIGNILWRNFSKNGYWSGIHVTNFWLRRWWRTLPNYYLFFIVSLIFHYQLDHLLLPFRKLLGFFIFSQNFLERHNEFYGVSWSLCVEEWFYLLFPIVLIIFSKSGIKRKPAFALSIFIFYLLSITVRQYLNHKGVGVGLRMITVARLDAIGSGVLVMYISSIFNISQNRKVAFLGLGLSLLFVSIIIPYLFNISYEKFINNPYTLLLVPLGSSLTLPYLSSLRHPAGIFKSFSTIIEKISLWSYSIYLCHIPILFTVYHIMGNFRENIYGNILSKAISLFLTIAFSAFLFKYFELPLTKRRPRELYVSNQIEKANVA